LEKRKVEEEATSKSKKRKWADKIEDITAMVLTEGDMQQIGEKIPKEDPNVQKLQEEM